MENNRLLHPVSNYSLQTVVGKDVIIGSTINDTLMLKRFLPMMGMLCVALISRAEDGPKVASKVQKVTVFLNGAQVTRTANVTIQPGNSTLVFNNISAGIDVQSIQVHAGGDFTILSVKQETEYLNAEQNHKRVDDLKAQQKILQDKISILQSTQTIYQQEENMLNGNQHIAGQNNDLDVTKLKQALDFQTARLIELKQKEQDVTNQQNALLTEIGKYNLQIADLMRGSSNASSNILVSVSSKKVVETQFTISYLVSNASWFPTYDIRAKNVNSPISIVYKANVLQNTGEEWKNVKLTLSTGNPTVSGVKPELQPDYLSLNMYYANQTANITKVSGSVIGSDDRKPIAGASVRIKGTSIGTVTDMKGNYSLQVPPGTPTLEISFIGYQTDERVVNTPVINSILKASSNNLNEVVVVGYSNSNSDSDNSGYGYPAKKEISSDKSAGFTTPIIVQSTDNQTSFEFNIDNPYTVPSDGKQYLVEIEEVPVNAQYQYAVVPKLSTDVFLTAKLTDWNKYNFLSGEANLFFEGTYIGKSLIDTHITTDTLNLSLGVDKNISVTRVLQKELAERQSLSSNKKETRDWVINVKNRKNQPVNLLVQDQVPVSQNSAIEVETQNLSGGKFDDKSGTVEWVMALTPAAEKKIELKYQVKYPKNQSVIVQ